MTFFARNGLKITEKIDFCKKFDSGCSKLPKNAIFGAFWQILPFLTIFGNVEFYLVSLWWNSKFSPKSHSIHTGGRLGGQSSLETTLIFGEKSKWKFWTKFAWKFSSFLYPKSAKMDQQRVLSHKFRCAKVAWIVQSLHISHSGHPGPLKPLK